MRAQISSGAAEGHRPALIRCTKRNHTCHIHRFHQEIRAEQPKGSITEQSHHSEGEGRHREAEEPGLLDCHLQKTQASGMKTW
ncbi:hypothetical protein AOLI_G00179900 [Acnodon oligacanthus]